MVERKPTITVQLDKNSVSRMDNIAVKMGLSRAKVASNLLSAGLVIVDFVDKTGLLQAAAWLEWVYAKVNGQVQEEEQEKPEGDRVTLTVNIPVEEVEYLTKLAERFMNNRAKIAANIILANLPDMEMLSKWGLLDLVNYFRKIKTDMAKLFATSATGTGKGKGKIKHTSSAAVINLVGSGGDSPQ